MPQADVLIAAAETVEELPEEIVLEVCARLEKLEGPITRAAVRRVTASLAPATVRQRVVSFVESCADHAGGVDGVCAAWMLRSAGHALHRAQAAQSIELVWTGPPVVSGGLRRTEQALIDLVDSAKVELLVVMYAAYAVGSI